MNLIYTTGPILKMFEKAKIFFWAAEIQKAYCTFLLRLSKLRPTMSVPITNVTTAVATVILADVRQKFVATMTNALQGTPQGPQLQGVVTGWLDSAIQQSGAGVSTLTIPVSGGGGGFVPQQPVGAQLGGLGRMETGAGASFGQIAAQNTMSQAPGGAMPDKCVRTLAECGVCRVPISQYPTAPPPGATCGYEQKKQNVGTCFCSAPAKVQGACGVWTCSGHKARGSIDGRVTKGKSGSTGGGQMLSAQQVVGLRQPTSNPPAFGQNPAMANNFANMMNQSVAFNPMNNQATNMSQSNQLMQSAQNQLGAPVNNFSNPLGGVNLTNALNSPMPTAVPVNNLLAGIPNAASNPLGQAGYQNPVEFKDVNDDTESDDDDDNGEEESIPIETTNPVLLQNAMSAMSNPLGQNPLMSSAPAQPTQTPAPTPAPAATNVNQLLQQALSTAQSNPMFGMAGLTGPN